MAVGRSLERICSFFKKKLLGFHWIQSLNNTPKINKTIKEYLTVTTLFTLEQLQLCLMGLHMLLLSCSLF